MDHAEVRDRLEEAALAPDGIERLLSSRDDTVGALRDHLEGCAPCRSEADGWRTTHAALAWAAPDSVRAPADARERVLAVVRERGVPRAPRPVPARATVPLAGPAQLTPRRWSPGLAAGLATAAAVAVLVGAVLAGRDMAAQREVALGQAESFREVVTVTDEALRDPDHRLATLARADGTTLGTVLVSPAHGEVVMVASGLEAPAGDDGYRCFVERDGRRTQIGWMWVDDGLGWWAGPVEGVEDLGRPGDVVLVSAEPDGGNAALVARF